MNKPNKKIILHSIRTKLFFALFSTVMIIGVFSAVIGGTTQANNLKEEVLDRVLLLADALEGQVYLYLDSLQTLSRDFASDGLIVSSVLEIEKNGLVKDVEILNSHLQRKKTLLGEPSLVDIGVIDAKGIVIASTNIKEMGESEAEEEHFIFGKDDVYISQEDHDHLSFHDSFTVSAPIRDPVSGVFLGLIVNIWETERLLDILSGKFQLEEGDKESELRENKALDIFLVNREKEKLVDSSVLSSALIQENNDLIVDTMPVRECQENGREISQTYQNSKNVKVIGASTCFVEQGWTLVAEIPMDEALSSVRRAELDSAIITMISTFLVVIVTLLLTHVILKPVRLLQRGVEIISRGDLQYRVEINSHDEVAELAHEFNAMADKLMVARGSLQQEVANKTQELKSKIEELEKFNEATVGRELKMIELKEQIKMLQEKIQRYESRGQ